MILLHYHYYDIDYDHYYDYDIIIMTTVIIMIMAHCPTTGRKAAARSMKTAPELRRRRVTRRAKIL